MKKSDYKSGMLLFITLFLVSLTVAAEEVKKEFHKEYNAAASTTLEISNRYGDVIIQNWNENKIVIDVKIIVELPNKERAEKLLNYIDVQFSEAENLISAKTIIDEKFNFSGWAGDSKRFRIDYNIKMPAEAALNLSNKYGNTEIDELSGQVSLDIKYGNLKAGKFTRGNEKPINRLNLAYGKGSIEETGWLDLNLRYCGSMNITRSQAILVNSKYSKYSFGKTSSVVGESKYDNINIEEINNLVLENGYTEVNIGVLNKKLDYNGSYGSFSVENIPAGFESLDIETRYMGVKLGIDESATYNLDAHVSYGGLKYNEDNFNNKNRIIENNSTQISGTVGKEESPTSKVKIDSSYGSVKLY